MADIVGEPISSIIAQQINERQKAHGSGVPGNPREPKYHAYLNSKTAWIKLASAVEVTPGRLSSEGLSGEFSYEGLAKYAVLFDGTSRLEGTTLRPRGTFDGKNNIWDKYDGAYGTGEFGLTPMPGIESADIQCLNRGSIKKATVQIKCYSPEQFKILDLLYLRIGYTVLLEWGWSPYLDNSGTLQKDYFTLTEQGSGGFFDSSWKNGSYLDFLNSIEEYRMKKQGNYDGLLCRVTNFTWTFAQDGSYDIELSLISLGDVVESLKTNISPNKPTYDFIFNAWKQLDDQYQNDDETKDVPPSSLDNWISAYFFINKLLLLENTKNTNPNTNTRNYWSNRDIYCEVNGKGMNIFGVFIDPKTLPDLVLSTSVTAKALSPDKAIDYIARLTDQGYTQVDRGTLETTTASGNYYSSNPVGNVIIVAVREVFDAGDVVSDQGAKDMVYIHWNTGVDDEDVINDQGLYIRFGHLLDIIQSKIIPQIKSNQSPIIRIDTAANNNKMYLFPYQVSLDPRVCIVNSMDEDVNSKKYYTTLKRFKSPKGYAKTMNIYLNCQKINDIISDNSNEKGDLDLFSFLESICSELNKALGGVNNLEPVIDETTNTLYIVDGSYTEPRKKEYGLELYGYNPDPKFNSSNFVRNFSIKTEITNDFATMATVGATAGGYVKGTENTMFSKWNKGLIDRFKEKLVPADDKTKSDPSEPQKTYVQEFWQRRYGAFGLTAPFDVENDYFTEDTPNISPEICDKNITLVSEFYKYCQSKFQEDKEKYSSPTNGFIPISLSVTMDGLSGIKIYNELNVETRFLPSKYPESLKFIIKGVNHKISGNDWETTLETVVIANNEEGLNPVYDYGALKSKVLSIINDAASALGTGGAEPNVNVGTGGGGAGGGGGTGGGGNNPPQNNSRPIPASASLKQVLLNAGYVEGKFVFELALAIGTKEGYRRGSTNRPSRNNNPGNLAGANFRDIDPGVTIEPPNARGEQRFAKFTTPELGAKALVEKKIKKWANGNYPGTVVNSPQQSGINYRRQWNVPSSLNGIAGRGVKLTLEQFFYIYAPPSDNNTELYITQIVNTLKRNYPTVTRFSRIIDFIDR
jgi:hypothetical protein